MFEYHAYKYYLFNHIQGGENFYSFLWLYRIFVEKVSVEIGGLDEVLEECVDVFFRTENALQPQKLFPLFQFTHEIPFVEELQVLSL